MIEIPRENASFLLKYLVFAFMLSIGLRSQVRDLARVRDNFRSHLRSLLAIKVGVPLLAIAIVLLFDLPPLPAVLMLLLAVCAGAPFIPAAKKTKAEPYSLFGFQLLFMASVLSVVTVPGWIWILERIFRSELEISTTRVSQHILRVVLIPLGLGLALRHFLPRAADVLGKFVHHLFLVALAVVAVIALYLGAPVFLEVSLKTVLAGLVFVIGSELIGYYVGAGDPEQRQVTTAAAALGNPGLTLAVVALSFPGFKAAAFVAAFVIFRVLALIPLELWWKHQAHSQAPPAHGPAAA